MSVFRHHTAPLTLVLALATAMPFGVAAQSGEPPRQAMERPSEHRALSDAVRRVERATNGQVLSAERVQFDGRDVNRVKIIDDRGRVRVYWDDPQAQRPDRRDDRRDDAGNRAARAERAQRAEQDRRDERARRAEPARRDETPRRTRRHDGAAFNL